MFSVLIAHKKTESANTTEIATNCYWRYHLAQMQLLRTFKATFPSWVNMRFFLKRSTCTVMVAKLLTEAISRLYSVHQTSPLSRAYDHSDMTTGLCVSSSTDCHIL